MKSKLVLFAALAVFCGITNAATMVSYETPTIWANKDLISSQLNWLTHDLPEKWNTSKIDFANVFGMEFDASLYDVKVTLLGSNFGITADGTNVNRYNAYGVEGSMNQVHSGVSNYTGVESYITYELGDPLSLLTYSHVFERTYDVFGENPLSYTWTTTDLETQYYATNRNGERVLVTSTLPTLLVGFDDSPGIWDNDFNDLILAVQVLAKDAPAAPSGQPLPGVMAALLIGGGTLVARKRKKMNAAK